MPNKSETVLVYITLQDGKAVDSCGIVKGRPSYDRSSEHYLKITKKLAIFIGSTKVPNNIIGNPGFRAFVKILDSRYPAPGRTLISKELDKVLVTLKQIYMP